SDPLSRRGGWHQSFPGSVDDLPDAGRHALVVEINSEPRARLLYHAADTGNGNRRRFRFARPVSFFSFLGSRVDPHVFPDRHLGARAAHLRCAEIYSVHHAGIDSHVCGRDLAVRADRKLRSSTHSADADYRPGIVTLGHRTFAVRSVFFGVRDQGAVVSAAYLAAGRAYRSAYGGFGIAGRRIA